MVRLPARRAGVAAVTGARAIAGRWLPERGGWLTLLAYVIAGGLGVTWLHALDGEFASSARAPIALVWVASGLAVAALYHYGLRCWPAVFVGYVVVWTGFDHLPPGFAVAQAVSEALGVVATVRILRQLRFRPAFDDYRDAVALCIAVLAGRSLSSLCDALTVLAAAWTSHDPYLLAGLRVAGVARAGNAFAVAPEFGWFLLRWWANTVSACMLVVPLLALVAPRRHAWPVRAAREGAMLALSVIVWIAIAHGTGMAALRPVLLAAGLLPVAWAATRFGAGVGALVTLVLGLSAAVGFSWQNGVFVVPHPGERLIAAWGFIGYLCVTSLALTTVTARRARARRLASRSAERYERLFAGSPYAMLAEDELTGRIILVNPAASRLYGYAMAEFLGLRAAALIVDRGLKSVADTLSGGNRERHRTRRGTDFEAEVSYAPLMLDGNPVILWFVEPLAERNALRQAVLQSSDLEREQLGRVIQRELLPLLADIEREAQALKNAPGSVERHERIRHVHSALSAGVALCSRLTRGASPLHWAGGDLAAALGRLPGQFPQWAVDVEVATAAGAEAGLSIERRDHLYRLVEEIVRGIAQASPGLPIRVVARFTAGALDIRVGEEGGPQRDEGWPDAATYQAIAARAAAVGGRLVVGYDAGGRPALHFRCDLLPQAPADAATAPDVATRAPEPLRTGARTTQLILRVGGWRGALLLGLAYYAAGAIGIGFVRVVRPGYLWSDAVFDGPWLASGIAVAGLMLGGRRLWPGIFIASTAVWHWVGYAPWLPALADASAEVLASFFVIYTLERFGFERACERPRDLALLFVVALTSQLAQLVVDIASALVTFALAPVSLPDTLRELFGKPDELTGANAYSGWGAAFGWLLAGGAGIVLVVPACVAWTRELAADLVRRPRELGAWVAGLLVTAAVTLTAGTAWRLHVLALTLLIVGVAVARFGAALAWVATLFVAIIATVGYDLHVGTLRPSGADKGTAVLWGFITLLAASAQLLTSMLAEGRNAEREARAMDLRYRALFGAVARPVFVYAHPSGRIRLANRAACERYGRSVAQFCALTLAELQSGVARAVPLPGAAQSEVVTTRHRLRHGRAVDVELQLVAFASARPAGGLCFVVDVSERNQLRQRLIEAVDRERRTLARDFHDGVGQVLTGLQFGVQPLLALEASRSPDPALLEFIVTAAHEARRTCEEVLRGTSPLAVTNGDLVAAIRHLPALLPPEGAPRLTVHVDDAAPVSLSVAGCEHLYRIAQEAVTNALRHARAGRVDLVMRVYADCVEITVADDGAGLPPAGQANRVGLGIESMRLRAAALGGRVEFTTTQGRGTTVHCRCPQVSATRARASGG